MFSVGVAGMKMVYPGVLLLFLWFGLVFSAQNPTSLDPRMLNRTRVIIPRGSSTLPNATVRGTGPAHGMELRILPVGDSITVGYRSNENKGGGNGYRWELYNELSYDYKITFAGTESQGNMKDDYFAAWSGQTVQVIKDRVPPSLQQKPNIILIHAGTNDMNPNPQISQQGNSPDAAAQRLGELIDECLSTCPNATVVVAQIIHTCLDDGAEKRTIDFNSMIPQVVQKRATTGHRVMIADMQSFPVNKLHHDDCIHPTNDGYKTLGNMWAQMVRQIPTKWVAPPEGPDPKRPAKSGAVQLLPWSSWLISALPTIIVVTWLSSSDLIPLQMTKLQS